MPDGLTPLEAYQQVMRFAALRGEPSLRLAMHAAVPQVLRPELVHLLRLNFIPESLADTSLEADVLFAPFCDDLGNGYFRFDAHARQRLLVHLDPAYEDQATLRSRQVAGFLLAHFDEPGHQVTSGHDPVYEAYLEVERWVALAFLDQEAAAAQLAAVVRNACDAEAVVARFRVAGLTSALSTPLARHHSLLTYAAGVEMLQRGDLPAAREVLESLGEREIEIAGVRLPLPNEVLRQHEARKPEAPEPAVPESQGEDMPEAPDEAAEAPAVPQPPAAPAPGRVFISYRRADAQAHAGRLYDYLSAAFSPKEIVIDVDMSIDKDFRSTIIQTVQSASVVVVIIGPQWQRNLNNPDDFVRIEVAAALGAGIPVLPILVNGARMPSATSLPRDLAGLAERNAVVLRDDRWRDDVQRVPEFIRQLQNSTRKRDPGPTRARLHFFISGTTSDLSEYRGAAGDALQKLGHSVVMVDSWRAGTPTSLQPEILNEIGIADAMVLILGGRYGHIPAEENPEGLSITELEYRTAIEHQIPVFVYMADEGSRADAAFREGTSEDDRAQMARFRARLLTNHLVARFRDPASLAEQIVADVSSWQARELPEAATTTGIGTDEQPRISGRDPEITGPVLMFAGHVIDQPARVSPRFPADKEEVAREAIRAMVLQELERAGRFACAMACASRGADILFHEVCLELGIDVRVYLPLSVKQFASTFIGRSEGGWLERFTRLATQDRVRTTRQATRSRHDPRDADWLHNAAAMFKDAKEIGGRNVTLIALWDNEQTGSPGAVADFVKLARGVGARVQIIDSRRLFGLSPLQ